MPDSLADAYHRGQRDALDAAIFLLRERLRKPPRKTDYHCYVAAQAGQWVGRVRSADLLLHLREGKNINQRIKAALRRKVLKEVADA